MSNPHSSLIVTRDGLVGQVIGIPTPPGYYAIIPKYIECEGPSPWSYKRKKLCRIIPSYGPSGLASVMEVMTRRWKRDPLYGTLMPYVAEEEITVFIHPRDALFQLISSTPYASLEVVNIVYRLLRETRIPITELGLTGSHALGNPHVESDIDLVVYGGNAVVRIYKYFLEIRKGPSREILGGLEVNPVIDLSWRRSFINGSRVTWVGVPTLWHCPPLRQYYSIRKPTRRYRLKIKIEAGQASALLYPPCVSAGSYWIISYEYNLGGLFYEGGLFEIDALGSDEGVIYLGLKEYPGRVRLLSPLR